MTIIDRNTPGNFCWFELATSDQNGAKGFYASLFGWEITDQPISASELYTIFKLHGRDVAAGYSMRPEQRQMAMPPNWMVYVAVDDVDATAHKVAGLGGVVHVPPFDVMDSGRMSVIQDPTGAVFAIWRGKNHQGVGLTAVPGTVSWADLSTPDPETAAAFYHGLFGWQITSGKDMSPAGPNDYGHIVNHGQFIGGVPPANQRQPGVPAHWMVYFSVADCAASTQRARLLGANVMVDTMDIGTDGKIAVLGDPQGAVFALHQGK